MVETAKENLSTGIERRQQIILRKRSKNYPIKLKCKSTIEEKWKTFFKKHFLANRCILAQEQ